MRKPVVLAAFFVVLVAWFIAVFAYMSHLENQNNDASAPNGKSAQSALSQGAQRPGRENAGHGGSGNTSSQASQGGSGNTSSQANQGGSGSAQAPGQASQGAQAPGREGDGRSRSASAQNNSALHNVVQELGVTAYESTRPFTTREIWVENEGQRIYGIAYIPTQSKRSGLAIISHGLNCTHSSVEQTAETLARHGYAAYAFDFCGGSEYDSLSDGVPTEMSVMTELSDLHAVMDAALQWDFVDPGKIVLVGESQGGLVSALCAAERPDEVAGLVLFYPAFMLPSEVQQYFWSEDEVPDEFEILGSDITVGANYVTDMWDFDVFDYIVDYERPVLIMHGTDDDDVDPADSEEAAELYEDCELVFFEGAGHGFEDEDAIESLRLTAAFMDAL